MLGPPGTIRRSDTRASRRVRCRAHINPDHPPKRRERAVEQDAWPVSIRPLRRSAASEPPGKTPCSSHRTTRRSDTRASCRASHRARLESPAEATRASRRARCRARLEPSAEATRASRRARCRARLNRDDPPKRHERAVGQYAAPVSIRPLRRSAACEPPGKTPGSSHQTTHRSYTRASHRARHRARLEPPAEATRASRRARCRARLDPNHPPKRYTSDPSSKPLPWSRVRSGAQAAASRRRRYRTEPLRLFAVNPLTVGELGRIVMGGVIPV